MATCVKNVTKEVVCETKSNMPENKETWWWNEEIQRVYQVRKNNLSYGRKLGREKI